MGVEIEYYLLNAGYIIQDDKMFLAVLAGIIATPLSFLYFYRNPIGTDEYSLPMKLWDGSKNTTMKSKVELKKNLSTIVTGVTRSGKTTTIKQLLPQLDSKPTIIYDPKNDFDEFIESNPEIYEDRQVLRLNPYHPETVEWDVFNEIEDDDFENVARRMVPETDQEYFGKAASRVLEASMRAVDHNQNNPEGKMVDKILSYDANKLQKALQDYKGAKELRGGSGDRVNSVLSAINEKPRFDGKFTGGRFSIRSFLNGDYGEGAILILQIPEHEKEIYEALVSFVLDWAIDLATSSRAKTPYGLTIVADEVARIPRMSNLEKLASLGGGQDANAIIGLQSLGQLRETYGSNKAESIIENSVQGIFHQSKSKRLAELIQGRLGKEQKTKKSKTYSTDRKSTSTRQVREYPITTADITRQDPGECIIDKPGDEWYQGKIKMNYE